MVTTPMMQQYRDAKEACGDALLLFRMGDFYELFFDDAKTAARELGLTLTSRDKGENPVPMAGFPYHQLDGYLAKIIAAGYRAAVCEQVEDPKLAKGLVKREVTRVVSPGTLTDDALLDPRESSFLAAIADEPARGSADAPRVGLAWAELSTGRFLAATFPRRQLADELVRIGPRECLVAEDAPPLPDHPVRHCMWTRRPPWAFALDTAQAGLCKFFGTAGLEGFGFTSADGAAIRAAGAILDYLQETQRTSLDHFDRVTPYRVGQYLELDESTRRSLEISRTLRDNRREGSLLAVIDRTLTPMGSRLLAEWVAAPLTEIPAIEARLDAVEALMKDNAARARLRDQLQGVYDLERLLARVATGRATPRDLSFIASTLGRIPLVQQQLAGCSGRLLRELVESLDPCPDVHAELVAALVEPCPLTVKDGGVLRGGYHAELDRLRELASGGKQWIAQYQAQEIARTGISKLKVGYNKVFGYYLEVSTAQQHNVPPDYHRKQTLKNAERYITPELKEYEEQVLTADEQARELEYALFTALRERVHAAARRLQLTAAALAQLDVLAALAELAARHHYARPRVVDEPVLAIVDGRHPVLDILEPQGTFVPNDTTADADTGLILLITGPNMAGKSTYIRQVALLTLLAQIGSFVPAAQAVIGVADRIFARVGASDELARGLSTFMVEMTETARILHNATPRSLVILDEIGRGTSTYDGLSLAWAIVEHLHDRLGCRTLFATHYHELTDLARTLSGMVNLNVSVKEWQDEVVFLHKIVPGAADKSYGIHVARLAGVPRSVNERAKQILAQLEAEHLDERGRPKIGAGRASRRRGDLQLTLFAPPEHPLLETIRGTDVDRLTPLEALQLLHQWRAELAAE
ncbi:MAG: DNA mismatch repair protein MutS [Pirellulaceae bacterium]|jgi:DNA mismatch repair protein MutS|nr:DNA mismatch repair protein MutS [Pirellulaceae bacterium]